MSGVPGGERVELGEFVPDPLKLLPLKLDELGVGLLNATPFTRPTPPVTASG